jgi:hypothetical protein
VQTAKDYSDGSTVKLTIAKWLTADGEWMPDDSCSAADMISAALAVPSLTRTTVGFVTLRSLDEAIKMSNMFIDKGKNIMQVEYKDGTKEVMKATKFMQRSRHDFRGARGAVIDEDDCRFCHFALFRRFHEGNPGGLMDEAIKMSNMFIDKGKNIMQVEYKDGTIAP